VLLDAPGVFFSLYRSERGRFERCRRVIFLFFFWFPFVRVVKVTLLLSIFKTKTRASLCSL